MFTMVLHMIYVGFRRAQILVPSTEFFPLKMLALRKFREVCLIPSASLAVRSARPAFLLWLCLSGAACSNFAPREQPAPPLAAGGNVATITSGKSGAAFQKAASLPALPLEVTPEVKREIDHFLNREPAFIAKSLERREEFYPMIVQIFEDEGLPLELINVALIESGFKPTARSYAGAVGLWQFMKSTGRVYGLKIQGKVDQRKDPILSTLAAARHLKDLYSAYGHWYLALAAYNAGQGGVDRAMVRARSDNYWELCRKRKLRMQTARYVPRIIAATLIINKMTAPDQGRMAVNLDDLRRANELGLLFGNS